MKTKKVKVFLDGVDFQHEVGHAPGGNKVYESVEDLKEHNRCWKSCGIVECEIKFKKWAVEQKLCFKNAISAAEFNKVERRLKHAKEHLKYLNTLVDSQKKKVAKLTAELKKENK